MFAWRHTLPLGLFFVALFLSNWKAFRLDVNQLPEHLERKEGPQNEPKSLFTGVDYFLTEKTEPLLKLEARDLVVNHQRKLITFTWPKGEAFSQDYIPYFYEGESGVLNQKDKVLKLKTNVFLFNSESELKAQSVLYQMEQGHFFAEGEVFTKRQSLQTKDFIWITSEKMDSWPKQKKSIYQGNVVGKVKRQRAYEPGVDFKSDLLKANLKQSKIELSGNVYLKKQEVEARSLRGEIYLENYNKELKYFALFDDVKVKELVRAPSGVFKRNAFAEKLEGFTSSDKIVLSGFPKVIQGGETIKGNLITLIRNKELVEVDDSNSNFLIRNR